MQNFRKTVRVFFEITALALVLLDVGLGLSAAWFRDRLAAEQQLVTSTRRHIQEGEMRVARLEKFQAILPTAQDQVKEFETGHVPSRRQAYFRAARLVRVLSEQSEVRLTGIGFKPEQTRDAVLFQRLGVDVNAEGSFANLVKFGYALETAGDFIVLRNCTFAPQEGGKLALHLLADLYLMP